MTDPHKHLRDRVLAARDATRIAGPNIRQRAEYELSDALRALSRAIEKDSTPGFRVAAGQVFS